MDIFDKISEIIVEQCGINSDIIDEDSTLDYLGIDSLDFVEVVMAIEAEYDIKVPDEDIENIETIGELAKIVEGLTA